MRATRQIATSPTREIPENPRGPGDKSPRENLAHVGFLIGLRSHVARHVGQQAWPTSKCPAHGLPPICRRKVAQACFIMEQDKISRGSKRRSGAPGEGSRRRTDQGGVPTKECARASSTAHCRTLRAPPSSRGRLHHHRHLHRRLHHSPSPPLSLNTSARTCPLAFLARDRCSAAAKPTRAAAACASSLAPPVALLSACGVSVTHARASLATSVPCVGGSAGLSPLCCPPVAA